MCFVVLLVIVEQLRFNVKTSKLLITNHERIVQLLALLFCQRFALEIKKRKFNHNRKTRISPYKKNNQIFYIMQLKSNLLHP